MIFRAVPEMHLADLHAFPDVATDVRGLKPARAELARLVAKERRERDALATLRAGRAKLAARIEAAETAQARQAAEVDAEAASIADAIRRGADFALSFVRRSAEPALDLTVARAALAKADLAISVKQSEIEGVAGRIRPAVAAVLREEAASIAATYERALMAAAEAAAQLMGLEAHLERHRIGRQLITGPGFPDFAGDVIDTRPIAISAREIAAGQSVWADFGRILSENPRADAVKLLRFPVRDPNAVHDVTYEQLSPAEMRIADLRNAQP